MEHQIILSSILYYVPTRTGQKEIYNIGVGFSATWSIPLDKEQIALCKEAAKSHNEYRAQMTANKRLDFDRPGNIDTLFLPLQLPNRV